MQFCFSHLQGDAVSKTELKTESEIMDTADPMPISIVTDIPLTVTNAVNSLA